MKHYNLKSQISISHRTLPERITRMLRESILSGELSGGTQLKQEELADKFSVSMSVLREALKRLEGEGLVTFYPNRGAAVSSLSVAEVQEIFDIRLFLELGALELAIPRLNESDLTRAAEILQETDDEPDNSRWSELNWRFHEILYQPAQRPKLLALIQTLHNNVERYMRLYLLTLHYQNKSQQEHRELLDACVRRDIAAAQAALRGHMTEASSSLTEYLNKDD